jgi:hypothetical protein
MCGKNPRKSNIKEDCGFYRVNVDHCIVRVACGRIIIKALCKASLINFVMQQADGDNSICDNTFHFPVTSFATLHIFDDKSDLMEEYLCSFVHTSTQTNCIFIVGVSQPEKIESLCK